jgi:hypothetical protein
MYDVGTLPRWYLLWSCQLLLGAFREYFDQALRQALGVFRFEFEIREVSIELLFGICK